MGDLQTPYKEPAMTPGDGSAAGSGTSGGFEFPDGKKETANMSGLPLLPTTVSPGEDAPGPNTQIPMPPIQSPGTIPTAPPGGGGE